MTLQEQERAACEHIIALPAESIKIVTDYIVALQQQAGAMRKALVKARAWIGQEPEMSEDFVDERHAIDSVQESLSLEAGKGWLSPSEAADLRKQLDGMTDARNRFCHYVCLIGDVVFGDKRDARAPDAVLRRVQELNAALESLAIMPDYDCPGDTPVVCGDTCLLCKGSWSGEPEHNKTCLLYVEKPQ